MSHKQCKNYYIIMSLITSENGWIHYVKLGPQETISDLQNSVSKIRIIEKGFQENTGLSGDFRPSPVIELLAHGVLIQMSWF